MFKNLTILIFLAILTLQKPENIDIVPLQNDESLYHELGSEELKNKVIQLQQQSVQKLLKHYINDQMRFLTKGQVYQKFTDQIQNTGKDIYNFMQNKLHEKFKINQMVPEFEEEIKRNPEKYYISLQIYYLVMDEL